MRVSRQDREKDGPRLREGHVQKHCCVKENLQENESCLMRIAEDKAKEADTSYLTDLNAG